MLQILQLAGDAGQFDPLEERRRRLAVGPFALIEADQPLEGFGDAAGRYLGGGARETGAVLRRAAADHDEVLGHRAATHAFYAPLESDRRDVVLAAAVRAAADLDARGIGGGDELG